MKSRTFTLLRSRTQRGFSLIEIMVGLAIGLVAVIIMMQAFAFSDSSKRITSGGDDAQINGGIALSGLERDIRMAGFGLNAFKLIGCTLNYTPTNEGSALTNALQIAPIIINPSTDFIPAGDANTDTLLVMYSNTNSTAEGDALISASSTAYRVTTPTSFVTGDKILPLPIPRPTTCTLTVDSVANVDSPNISVATGTTLKAGDIIFNIGNAPIIRAYAIRNGNLTMCRLHRIRLRQVVLCHHARQRRMGAGRQRRGQPACAIWARHHHRHHDRRGIELYTGHSGQQRRR